MPRQPRIHIEEGLYFIATKGDRDMALFRDDKDREEYLALLGRYVVQYRFKLHAYVLMPKFINLLIELGPGSTISDVMHVINSTYTKHFNNRYGRHGHLFQGRYRSVVVEKGKDLTDLTRYIHLVPVIEGVAGKAEDYIWSSYSKYLESSEDAKDVLERFSGISEEQIKLYKRFVDSISKEDLGSIKKKVQRSRIIGSREFISKVKKGLEEVAEQKMLKVTVPSGERRPNKMFVLAGSTLVLILCVIMVYSFIINLRVANRVETIIEQRDEELKKDLQEKYRTDLVAYYHAMVKRLERERSRSEDEKIEREM